MPNELSTPTDEMPHSGNLQIRGWKNGAGNGPVRGANQYPESLTDHFFVM